MDAETNSNPLDLSVLRRFPPTQTRRRVYFDTINPLLIPHLEQRGYEVVLLMSLPRETEEDARTYLLALSQGMSEDTIFASKERLNACELEMKARKMLTAKELPPTKTKAASSVEDILEGWTSGRHSQTIEPQASEQPHNAAAQTSGLPDDKEAPKQGRRRFVRKVDQD